MGHALHNTRRIDMCAFARKDTLGKIAKLVWNALCTVCELKIKLSHSSSLFLSLYQAWWQYVFFILRRCENIIFSPFLERRNINTTPAITVLEYLFVLLCVSTLICRQKAFFIYIKSKMKVIFADTLNSVIHYSVTLDLGCAHHWKLPLPINPFPSFLHGGVRICVP